MPFPAGAEMSTQNLMHSLYLVHVDMHTHTHTHTHKHAKVHNLVLFVKLYKLKEISE